MFIILSHLICRKCIEITYLLYKSFITFSIIQTLNLLKPCPQQYYVKNLHINFNNICTAKIIWKR